MFFTVFSKLCEKNKTTPSEVCSRLGLSHGSVTHWKNGISPRQSTIIKISNYFSVSPSIFYGKETIRYTSDQYLIPIIGEVSCGVGTIAEEDILGYEPVDEKYYSDEYYYLRAKGTSMSPKIEDGDLVLIHRQDNAESGTLAVVIVDQIDGLLKKLVFDDYHISLISYNSVYPPMEFVGDDRNRVHVIGVAIQLKRNL